MNNNNGDNNTRRSRRTVNVVSFLCTFHGRGPIYVISEIEFREKVVDPERPLIPFAVNR